MLAAADVAVALVSSAPTSGRNVPAKKRKWHICADGMDFDAQEAESRAPHLDPAPMLVDAVCVQRCSRPATEPGSTSRVRHPHNFMMSISRRLLGDDILGSGETRTAAEGPSSPLRSVPRLGDKREKGIPQPAHRAGSDGGPARLRAPSVAAFRRPEAHRLRCWRSRSRLVSVVRPPHPAPPPRSSRPHANDDVGQEVVDPKQERHHSLEGGPAPRRIASLDSNYSQLP
jgi:hypothetical protein